MRITITVLAIMTMSVSRNPHQFDVPTATSPDNPEDEQRSKPDQKAESGIAKSMKTIEGNLINPAGAKNRERQPVRNTSFLHIPDRGSRRQASYPEEKENQLKCNFRHLTCVLV